MISEMSVYCHSTDYRLRTADMDFKDELKLSALLSLTQESACLSADELGFGYDDLRPKKMGFIIVNTYCELYRPIRYGKSDITVETWPRPPRHVIFERAYRVKCEGELMAALTSRWCLVDLNNFSLLTPDKLGKAHTDCPYNPQQVLDVSNWKIPKIGEDGKEVARVTVKNSLCDHYFHANNARYADLFFDCFTMDELAARPVKSFQITYGKQAKEDCEVRLIRKDYEDGVSRCEAYADTELLSQFSVRFGDSK
ncbi:MAG: hypothetical protein K2N74_02175 [Clostridiales bacterium]|nr:hypothetical protein [Clostridiales bacterium]